MRGNRSSSRFALLIRLPPTAGIDIKASQPTAVDGAGIDAQRETKIQDLTGSLRRVAADDALARFVRFEAIQGFPVQQPIGLFIHVRFAVQTCVDENVVLCFQVWRCALEKLPMRIRNDCGPVLIVVCSVGDEGLEASVALPPWAQLPPPLPISGSDPAAGL